MEERLLTVREVAELTQLHEITIRRYIKAGKLDAVRIGRRIRVPREALAQLVKPMHPARADQPTGTVKETTVAYRTKDAPKADVAESDGANSESAGSADPLWDIVGLFDSGLGGLAEEHDEWPAGTVGRENAS